MAGKQKKEIEAARDRSCAGGRLFACREVGMKSMRSIIQLFIVLLLFLVPASSSGEIEKSANEPEKSHEALQIELNKIQHKNKILSRLELVEGLTGFSASDISVTLVDYSYHNLNNSGIKQPFVTVKCRLDLSRLQKEAEDLEIYLRSTGKHGQINLEILEPERIVVGFLDNLKNELITLASFTNSMRPIIKFADLRKGKPEYVIVSLEPNENCVDCNHPGSLNTAIFGFDEKEKSYYVVLDTKTYAKVEDSADLDGKVGYIDKSEISWSDWINDEYRELVISTTRELMNQQGEGKAAFRNKKEIFSWVDDEKLVLTKRILEGNTTMDRLRPQSISSEITLKDGELYEMNGEALGAKLTETEGMVSSYLLSPDKRYIAYSVIIGYTDDVGLYEDGEEPPQVPLYKIAVMDFLSKKQLREINQISEIDPFMVIDRWISDDELYLWDSEGYGVNGYYIYNANINSLRMANLQEREALDEE